MRPSPPGPGPWTRRALRLCLMAWPRAPRTRDGASLVAAALDHLAERSRRGGGVPLLRAAAECASIVRAGLALRLALLRPGRRSSDAPPESALAAWTSELRISARSLVRSPGFAVTAVATLALGVGANAAIFGLANRTLFRPLPFEHPDRLVLVWNTLRDRPTHVPVPAPDVAALRRGAPTLEGVAFMNRITDGAVEAQEGDAAEHVRLALVTADFFDVLGVQASRGRTFVPEDAVSPDVDAGGGAGEGAGGAGAPRAVILADGLWRRVFGADPAVVGRTVRLDGVPAVVVGIMPPDFHLPLPPDAGIAAAADAWVPLRVPLTAFRRNDGRRVDQDSDNSGVAIARLAPGATLQEARAEARRVGGELRAEVPAYRVADRSFEVRGLKDDATAHERPLLVALMAGAAAVLLVACLNLSTLLLARGARRRGEMALRLALGAGARHLGRRLLSEGLLILAAGGAVAVGVAWAGCAALGSVLPAALSPLSAGSAGSASESLTPDLRVLFAALAVAGVVLILFAVLPAVEAATRGGGTLELASSLRRGRRRGRLRDGLVVAEVAASVVLVLAAGLLVRTVHHLQDVRPGFEPDGALVFSLSLRTPGRYRSPADRARLMHEIEGALDTLPGVRSVGLVGHLPLSGRRWSQPYGLPGEARSQWNARRADFRMVTSGYFAAVGTRLVTGRTFTSDEDLNERRRVVIVDEALARRIAPGGSALGARVGFPLDGEDVDAQVVGVVERVRFEDLESPGDGALYVPYRQEASRDVSLVLRTAGDPSALGPSVRRTVRAIDTQLPVYDLQPLADYVADAIAPRRFALDLLAGYAVLALLAAGLGLFGVVSFEVTAGTRDIGVRMAVGATRRKVVTSVLARGLRLTAVGLGLGALLAAGTATALTRLLYGVAVSDAPTWAGVLGAVVVLSLVACWLPALRASRLDPTSALRAE